LPRAFGPGDPAQVSRPRGESVTVGLPAARPRRLSVERKIQVGFAVALAHFRAMRFVDAYTIWDALAREERDASGAQSGKNEPPQGPPAKMAERAREFAAHPPPEPWDGVWVLTSK